jgi:hypothetical protein
MKKWFGWIVIALLTMYFFPQFWYFVLAVAMLAVVLVLCLALLAFMAKALGIAGLEVWIAQRILRKKRRS